VNQSATAVELTRLALPLRRWTLLASAGLAATAGTAILTLFAWTARLGWVDHPGWVLVTWVLVLAGIVAVLALGFRRLERLSPAGLADRLEGKQAWRHGALRGLLEPGLPDTSPSLWSAADRARAAELGERGSEALAPWLAATRGSARVAAIGLGIALLVLAAARPTSGAAAALWHPARAWHAAIAPLRVTADHEAVDRGSSVTLTLDAPLRRRATLWLRAPGEVWRARPVHLDSLGRAAETVGPLDADLYARVSSGGRSSDTIRVHVRTPAFLGAVSLVARYPGYLHLEDEPIPTSGDTVLIPAGTRLDTRGQATAALSTASWALDARRLPLNVEGDRFDGTFAPTASGLYRLALETTEGTPLSGDPASVALRIVADSVPRVELPVPGTDTVAPLSLRLPLVIDVHDDHGITQVAVESRRISRLGFADPPRTEAVPLPATRPDRAILTFELDLNQRGLLPGDTVRYFARALDNAPHPQMGRTREFVLRLATLSEIREAARQASQAVSGRLDSVVTESQRLERQTEDLARERARLSSERGRAESQTLPFEAAKRAEAVAAAQEQQIKDAEAIKRSLEALQRSAEAAGLNDPAWQQRLQEIRDQIDRALTPDLRAKLADLQRALKELDPDQTRDALAQLAEAQKQLKEALERSKELFQRAAIEGDLANLSADSKELAREQSDWLQRLPSADSLRAAAEEKALGAQADSLAQRLSRTSKQMPEGTPEQRLQDAARQAAQAAQQMAEAEQEAKAADKEQAREHGEEALQSLGPLGQQLDQQRRELQEEWRKEVLEGLDQALAEASRLAQGQLDLMHALEQDGATSATRSKQAAVEDGTQRLLERVQGIAGKNALVTGQSGVAIAGALDEMRQAREAISNPVPNAEDAAEHAGQAVDQLNLAAVQLSRARGGVAQSKSGAGLTEALEQLSQMASQQGQVGRQSGGLLPLAGNPAAIQAELKRLAAQQRALAQGLERLHSNGDIPGAGAMADEAKELARRLEAGRLDRETVERQEKLFRRMLDAGRTLQGREDDEKKERQSVAAGDDSVHLPPALRAQLLGDNGQLRLPTWEELQRLSPEERRLVVEYFRRLTETPAPQR